MSLCRLAHGNAHFATETERVLQHKPYFIVICCSDARVSPELIFNIQTIGDLFVVRTAGGILDDCGLESVRFALEQCHAKEIIVLGHEGCGAITASLEHKNTNRGDYFTFYRYLTPHLKTTVTASVKNVIQHTKELLQKRFNLSDAVVHTAYYELTTGRVIFQDGNLECVSQLWDYFPLELSLLIGQAVI